MTALESWMYDDPERVAIHKQQVAISNEKACGKCAHRLAPFFKNEEVPGCKFKRRIYGQRCELYKVEK